jgi:hypothetical protein
LFLIGMILQSRMVMSGLWARSARFPE